MERAAAPRGEEGQPINSNSCRKSSHEAESADKENAPRSMRKIDSRYKAVS